MASNIQARLSLYNNMSSTLQGIINSMNNVISAATNVESATGRMFDRTGIESAQVSLNKAGAELAKMQNDIENNTIEQEKYNDKLREADGIASGLKRTILGFATAYLGIQGVRKFFAGADQMAGINARLGMIADKQHTVKDLQEEIFQSAERSRGVYAATADIIGKLGTQAGNAFKDNNELIAFSEQLNKNLVLAGTDPEGVRSVMYNLTQAMASGVLRGQDLNAVMANAPNILAKVADYLGKDRSQIRKLAEEGQLSAEVIKNALLNSASETNKAFEDMPKTLGQMAIDFKNNFTMAMMPTFEKFTAFMNTDKVQRFSGIVINAAVMLANIVGYVVNGAITGVNMLYNAWDSLKIPLLAIIGIIALYKSELAITGLLQAITSGGAGLLSVAYMLLKGATLEATLEQMGLNAALLASPIFWIPAIIIGVIALLYGLIAVINKVKGTSYSATGVIVGVISAGIAILYNLVVGLVNGVITEGVTLINAFIAFGEFIKNVFVHPVAAVKSLFANLITSIIGMLKVATNAIDTILGSDLTNKLDGLENKVNKWKDKQLPDDYKKSDYLNADDYIIERKNISDTYLKFYEKGKNFAGNINNTFKNIIPKNDNKNNDVLNLGDSLKDIANTSKKTKDHAKSIKNKMDKGIDIKNEDLTYLRELAVQRSINKFSFDKIVVNATNEFGDIHNISDLAGFTEVINVGLESAIQETAEGLGAI